MQFQPGLIHDILRKPLRKYHDQRGWLCELFRHDEIPAEFHPVMAYISVTEPGIARGPHEHVEQADCFCFLGPGNFRLYMWDRRPHSPTHRTFETEVLGADNPMLIIIPPGVVHAYKNVSAEPGVVFNCANRLYRGWGRQQPVDEIRHEDDAGSPYRLE
jgi:dTDP-4-dehydrorhamnose 3,5-epimerase